MPHQVLFAWKVLIYPVVLLGLLLATDLVRARKVGWARARQRTRALWRVVWFVTGVVAVSSAIDLYPFYAHGTVWGHHFRLRLLRVTMALLVVALVWILGIAASGIRKARKSSG